jgi:hypothetical protein
MENNMLQEYISALVDERNAGLQGCELMYLRFIVHSDPFLQIQFRKFVAIKTVLSTRKVLQPCPQKLAFRIHDTIRRMYLARYRSFV